MKKLLRFAGVALLALTIGVFGCGDDDPVAPVAPTVTVTVPPTTPTTPTPTPLSAEMTPTSFTIGVGGTVVFAISVSGGAAGAEASWICTSSDPSKATASKTPAGCQATAVAAGGVTITAVVTKGGETVNKAAGLTITEDIVEQARVFVASIKDSDENDDVLSGRVTVTLNVEFGDQAPMQLSVLVDGVDGMVAATLPFGGSASAVAAVAAPEGEEGEQAQQQAVHSFDLSFNSAEYAVTGEPTYMNGEHTISAVLMVAGAGGDERVESGIHDREFGNDDGVQVMVTGLGPGAMNSATGQMWYGGPAAMIEITALPVLYSGGSASSVGMLGGFCGASTATDAEAPFVFTPSCKGTSNTTTANATDPAGDTPEFTIAGADVVTLNGDDIFPLYVDNDGPPAPTFYPNPNGREGGWVNLAVDFLGEQKTSSNEDGWLRYNKDDAGVGGYQPVLRYAAVPRTGAAIDAAIAAPILTLANLPSESDADKYCAVASAVDLLGNESDLPEAKEDGGTCMPAGTASNNGPDGMAGTGDDGEVEAIGYHLLFENAMAAAPTDAAVDSLANAGLLVGVDITPPVVEYTAGGIGKDQATTVEGGWVLHVTDGGSGLATDPIDASIEVRDADGTEDVDEAEAGEAAEAGEFVVTPTSSTRFTTTITSPAGVGYYTFAATATDKAGNETDSGSRVALNDGARPGSEGMPVRLFVVPGKTTLLMTRPCWRRMICRLRATP